MTDTPAGTTTVTRLLVLSGLHAGASCELPGGGRLIGSGAADDVILGDAGILPGHLTLDVQGAAATLRPAHAGVAVDGAALPPDDPFTAALPLELSLAGVALRIEAKRNGEAHAADAARAPPASSNSLLDSVLAGLRPALKPAWRLPALACAAAALVTLASAVSSTASDAQDAERPATAPAPAPIETAGTAPDPAPTPLTLADAVRDLRAEFATRSLAGIQLAASDGTILARGQLDPQREEDWRRVQRWFDGRHGRYGRNATLVDEVRFALAPAPAVQVDAVWAGRNPNVVIKGQRFFEGATLPNGYHLQRILPDELLVERDGQRLALKF